MASACQSAEEDNIKVAADAQARLAKLKSISKFGPEDPSAQLPLGYVGYLPPNHRKAAEKLVNAFIDKVQAELKGTLSRAWLKHELNDTYDWFGLSDTEDRERCAFYLEQVLAAVGLPSAEQDINFWLTPFDPIALASHPHLEND